MRRPHLFAVALAILLASTPSNAAPITNGSFETGNFTGWSLIPASGGGFGFVANIYIPLAPPPSSFSPTHGSFLAYLGGGENGVYTTLGQIFDATAGDVLSFDVFFKAEDADPANDDAFVNLFDASNNLIANLFTSNIVDVGDFGTTGWVNVKYTFASSGTFLLLFGVRNAGIGVGTSVLGIDNVRQTSSPPPPPPVGDLIPEPGTLWLLGGTVLGVVALARNRRRG
jgi:hypothetical protein